MGRHPTANYTAGLDYADKQAIISQQRLSSKMLGLWINNSLTTYVKRKFRDSKSAYTLKSQDDGSAMLFVIVKEVRPDTR